MLYELREYTAVPGALPRLIDRFNHVTVEMFRKHDMDLVFLSRTELGEDSKNQIVYVLRFDSYDEVEKRWAAFFADPEWKAAAAASEADGPLVASVKRRILTTAEFPGTG
ncbi:NIPSNAP family protein [Pseudonocardia saturnea]